MLASTILCIFEGEKREVDYFKSMEKALLKEGNADIIKCAYGNDIFELFEELDDDRDLNVFDMIKFKSPKNERLLAEYEYEDINQIYLFFDIECQDEKYDAVSLKKMLEIFNQEDELGKLFISYPMVEALRDVPSFDRFLNLTVAVGDCKGKIYKQLSAERGMNYLSQIKKLDSQKWIELVKHNIYTQAPWEC